MDVKAGAEKTAEITLDAESFECFDADTNSMRTLRGEYEVFYGNSSADNNLKCIEVKVE